jgi:divalent metal cation (Fe/Co/Zn/Cd) transporter
MPRRRRFSVSLNGTAGGINLIWALVLIRSGPNWKSPALVAGGKHIMTDVWTTGAVLVGFALVPITGWLRLDPLSPDSWRSTFSGLAMGCSGSRSAG